MAGGEEGVVEAAAAERKRGLSGSMSLRTRKLGRRLSRSMSIVALKLPEKAQSITRSSTKLMRSGSRDKKNRSFELSVILPDKTQRQVTVWGNSTVAEVVCESLLEVGAVVAGLPSGPVSAPLLVPLGGPLPTPDSLTLPTTPPTALLFLGGSNAPVDPRAQASLLEGEVLVADYEPQQWDGKDMETFIAWEKIYASTLLSAVELYGKPLLRAAIISKEEYHLLFYYLEAVSEASEALTERMKKYLESGLLLNGSKKDDDAISASSKKSLFDDDKSRSILNELLEEGVITHRDVDGASMISSGRSSQRKTDEHDNMSSISSIPSLRKVIVNIPIDCNESVADSSITDNSENVTNVSTRSGRKCCVDHRISSDAQENVWANVRWDFLNPLDFGYDLIRSVKRSRSESAIATPIAQRKNDEIYELLQNIDIDRESCGSITPYESIEDLYDCIKNAQYMSAADESSPSTESQSEPQFPDYYEKSTTRQSSASSEKSGASSAFPFSKCGSSDSTGAFASCESTSGISNFVTKSIPESLKSRELPRPPRGGDAGESAILLKQLFTGELLDAYGEFLSAYPYARSLLRRKTRRDEHFVALADIRRGAAKHTIQDYLELPIERLAQYERLVGGGCARRRAARLSDLERVQDLFPHDYLALHDADAPAALASHHAQKSKSLRKRPSLDLVGTVSPNSSALSPRTFIMEAPVQLCPLGTTSPPLDRHLFLFSDLLLVGKSRGTNCFKLKESVRLAEVWQSMPDGDDTGFLLGWPTCTGVANYMATYPTQAARDTWYRKIQNALTAQLATEPKATNIQIFYKDMVSCIEFCKTVSVGPEMSARCVVRQALHVLQGGEGPLQPDRDADGRWGASSEFTLCVRTTRDGPPTPLHGIERPHAIQMSRIRQTLSNEDGFDLEHVNAKNNPCGLVFELRKKNQGLKNAPTSGVGGRGLRLLRRGGGRLFGVPLPRLCSGAPPPALLHALRRLRALAPNTHGVFRRSANAKALRLLRDKLDALGPWTEGCPELDRAPVLLLAALVKEFFRALPQPLLSSELYPSWLQVLNMSQTEKMPAVRSLLLRLPKSHYNMLSYFVCLLQAIAKKANINFMCPMNLGVCVGPSLLWPSAPCEKAPKAVPMVVELLIVKAEELFGPQVTSLLGNGTPETSNALLDSGAEESDSLHSVGISLDSMELSTPRKEKLSLSRDSGLTLSEDDSNSNGGNSPAPRNILHSLSAPTCNLQQESKLVVSRYNTDNHNVSGLPHVSQRQNIYSNKGEIYSTVNEELYNAPYLGDRYVHNSINIGITNGLEEKTYVTKTAVQRSTADLYGQSPAKYITGLEPQKPPRSNITRAARTSKVYSMYAEKQESDKGMANKNFNRAKSSDNLLEPKQEAIDKKRDLVSSQENIVYSNIHDLAMFTENIQRHNEFLTTMNTNYSRVYTGWEKNNANYSTGKTNSPSESIYGQMLNRPEKKQDSSTNNVDGNVTPAATIFTRNDWSRQAARTKSLEVNDENQNANNTERVRNGNYDILIGNVCRKRRLDPAHLCTKSCSTSQVNISSPEKTNINMNPLKNSYSYVDTTLTNYAEDNKKSRLRTYNNNKLNQSKSLANIMMQSDSSSSDTLYQPQSSFNSRSAESTASENSFEHCYPTQYIEPLYTSVYNMRRDIFHDQKAAKRFPSDIYKATPTAVQPEYSEKESNNNTKKPPHAPPPVPPRKMVYQRVLKKFQPVHVNKDDKASRSKSVPPIYRDPPNGADKNGKNVLALDCSESDTESESYV